MEGEMEGFSIDAAEFPDFLGVILLDSIDFNDLFLGIEDGDVLPDLEMDAESSSPTALISTLCWIL